MARIDPHTKVLDDRVVARAKQLGLDGLVFAPHFTRLPDIERRARMYTDDALTVFPARELFTGPWRQRRHVLAIGLHDPVPDFLGLEATIAELERQEAAILAPHPGYFSVGLEADDVRRLRDRLHAIEVYNPKYLPHHTQRSRKLATETGLSTFASSYAHLSGTVGEVWTEFDTTVETVDELAEAIKVGSDSTVHRRNGSRHVARRLGELGHICWENSWKKAVRVLGSGIEATHPRHPAYDGRFNDDAVY